MRPGSPRRTSSARTVLPKHLHRALAHLQPDRPCRPPAVKKQLPPRSSVGCARVVKRALSEPTTSRPPSPVKSITPTSLRLQPKNCEIHLVQPPSIFLSP